MIPNFTRMKKKLYVHNEQEMAKMLNDSLGDSQIQQSWATMKKMWGMTRQLLELLKETMMEMDDLYGL